MILLLYGGLDEPSSRLATLTGGALRSPAVTNTGFTNSQLKELKPLIRFAAASSRSSLAVIKATALKI